MVVAEQARDASYAATTQAQSKVVAIGARLDEALRELVALQEIACGPVYEKIFIKRISRAGDNYNMQVAEIHPEVFMEG